MRGEGVVMGEWKKQEGLIDVSCLKCWMLVQLQGAVIVRALTGAPCLKLQGALCLNCGILVQLQGAVIVREHTARDTICVQVRFNMLKFVAKFETCACAFEHFVFLQPQSDCICLVIVSNALFSGRNYFSERTD